MTTTATMERSFMRRSMTIVIALLIVASGGVMVAVHLASAASDKPLVVVSLTWDDGRASQATSLDIQQRHGMAATYYVNSAMIGSSGWYLTRPQLDALAAAGNEIGGHTERHENLTTISLDQARQTICGDRDRLVSWYGSPAGRSFAYPYGASNPDVRSIVSGCGYSSGRNITGVMTPYVCSSCRVAESLPPADPMAIVTPTSVSSSTTLADLQFQVIQASLNGGGWVPYTFHDIGRTGESLSIDPALYSQFLDWLASRSDVRVMTVGDVMDTAWTPVTPTTTPITTPVKTPMTVTNAELETDANGDRLADCFSRAGFGSNSATWSRTTDAHSGTAAEQVSMTQWSTGDRKLLVALDASTANGGCAPAIDSSSSYDLSVWYRSTVSTRMVVYLRDAAGTWKYWSTGPELGASSGWTQTVFATGAPPAGTTAISWGLSLASVGTLTVDDFGLSSTPLSTPYADALVRNASLEADADRNGVPDCWRPSGFGTNTASFTRVTDARTGIWGERLSVTSMSSGDRKIVMSLDAGQSAGGCAIDAVPGSRYQLGVWYHSSVPVTMFVYVRDTTGTWRWWMSGDFASSPDTWTLASRVTNPLPSWATAMSFGLGLTSVGTVVSDDYSASVV